MLRWFVPLVTALLLVIGGAAVATISANARGSLPPRSAARLLVDVQNAKIEGFSGTVVQTAELGLPALPNLGGHSSSDFSALVSGSHTLRVWYAGPSKARVALLGDLGESDVIRDGSDLWLWSSSSNTAKHLRVPSSSDTSEPADSASTDVPVTPQQAADMVLKAITPSTRVSTDPTAVVAGRPAYQLVLEPKEDTTLVGSVKIAIDGATHIPTRVQVFQRGVNEPAFEVGFTSFNPSTPSSSVFSFNPPPGAKVSEGLGASGDSSPRDHAASDPTDAGAAPPAAGEPETTGRGAGVSPEPRVVGTGWSTVVVTTLPSGLNGSDNSGASPLGSLDAIVRNLPEVSGSWGSGHLLRGTLFSVLVTDDGRLVAGSVAPEVLYAALASS
jgi:outer membrane lipoprotein-sorting protein